MSFFPIVSGEMVLRKKSSRARPIIAKILVFFFLGYFAVLCFFARSFLLEGFLFGKTLLVITNENEARPCGGFVSAYGILQFFPPKLQLRDVYAIGTGDLGKSKFPLNRVSATRNFWDLADTPDLSLCAQQFEDAYQKLTGQSVDHVLLLNFQTLEKIAELLGEKNFFANISRRVADLDRHDEKSLSERKNPMKDFAKKFIFTSLYRPDIPIRTFLYLDRERMSGAIFSPEISPRKIIPDDAFSVFEWNLGGAKSSRFLKKILRLEFREISPSVWDIHQTLSVSHLGGIDEPLSQEWRGGFEFVFPDSLHSSPVYEEFVIFPGESWQKEFSFSFKGEFSRIPLFFGRNQEFFVDMRISLFPQKTFSASNFSVRENVGTFFGKIVSSQTFFWKESPDLISPFVTIHELISRPAKKFTFSQNANTFVEIHLNEPVRLDDNFSATLIDRDFSFPNVSENPVFLDAFLDEDQRTVFLSFEQQKKQPEERYFLQVSGIRDLWGNALVPQNRTVIDRVP